MKRTLAAGAFSLAIGAVSLLLLASVVYSCRSGGDPHHERSDASLDTPPVEDARSVPPDHRAST
ncbi:hypothetical protein [Salinibacter ruber]|uniref:hypothetical protein n=1 Tax=Salinibacter ruber TaxID=146919 RepID=UPI0021670BCD|nr:hypothetical protein [Salinibacter ruber]MCS4049947.1 hypothetical protein [Salinibacter ruber]